MALPTAPEARPFYRSAKQRFEDAQFLVEGGRTTGAVYLAGYGVECILKALILNSVPKNRRAAVLATFRGARAHYYEWLRSVYMANGGQRFPPDVTRCFVLVNDWSTDIRYAARTIERAGADEFIDAVEKIIDWAEGRM